MLKIIIFVSVFAFVFADSEHFANIKKAAKDCQAEDAHKVSYESIEKFVNSEPVDDPQLGEHFYCHSKKLGYWKDDGKLNVEKIKGLWEKFYTPEKYEKILECLVEKSDPVATMYNIFVCKRDKIGLNKTMLKVYKGEN